MPAPSRAQRRRANTAQNTPGAARPRLYPEPTTEAPVQGELQAELSEASAAAVTPSAPTVAPSSNSRVARRLRTRSAPEPVDYTKDYRDVAKDLRLIAIWSVLLFAIMFGLYFARASGLI